MILYDSMVIIYTYRNMDNDRQHFYLEFRYES